MTIHPTSSINQSWDTLDNLGNWKSFSEDADGAGAGSNLNQSRTVNAANELTGIGGTGMNWVDPTYDAAGNMTNMPIPGDETSTQTGKYDAWNHLISIEQNSTAVGVYEYDGLGRRIQKLTDTILGSNATEHIYFNEKWQILETVVGGWEWASKMPALIAGFVHVRLPSAAGFGQAEDAFSAGLSGDSKSSCRRGIAWSFFPRIHWNTVRSRTSSPSSSNAFEVRAPEVSNHCNRRS